MKLILLIKNNIATFERLFRFKFQKPVICHVDKQIYEQDKFHARLS